MRPVVLVPLFLIAAVGAWAQDAPVKDAPKDTHNDAKGIAPRAAPGDYQGHAQAGAVSIGAEFAGHFVPTPEVTLTTEDFVIVEVGLFGQDGARLTLSPGDFSLRINGKKQALPSQPYGMVAESLKDPEWEPPSSSSASKSKTSIGSGGKGESSGPPPPVHVPIELRRQMTERARKASLAEGDRPLPQAGLLFFPYRGKSKGISSIELIYNGPAGQATVELHP